MSEKDLYEDTLDTPDSTATLEKPSLLLPPSLSLSSNDATVVCAWPTFAPAMLSSLYRFLPIVYLGTWDQYSAERERETTSLHRSNEWCTHSPVTRR